MRDKFCVPFRKINNWIKRNIAKYIFPEIDNLIGKEFLKGINNAKD